MRAAAMVFVTVLGLAGSGLAVEMAVRPGAPASGSPAGGAPALAAARQEVARRRPDVPWLPSPLEVVSAMLTLAKVQPGDVVYDLGCGDGRIPIAAARDFGARAVGIELDPQLAKAARENVRAAGVEDRVRILQQDLFESDLREATVVTLYLLSSLNLKVRPKLLRELGPGARVVSHAFDMGDWKPDRELSVTGPSLADSPEATIYCWVMPSRGTPQK
jgi:precorrin-6B methylase 2